MARRLAGTVIINGTDDEWFGAEHVDRTHIVESVLDLGQPASVMEIPHVRWGGECRVEVTLNARVVGTGQIQIEGNAKLFEGITEDTEDLEDEKVISFTVLKGGVPSHYRTELHNAELFAGDHAQIKLSFTNSFDEPPE